MNRRQPENPSPQRQPYARPELKEFGTIAALTENSGASARPDNVTMGNDKSA